MTAQQTPGTPAPNGAATPVYQETGDIVEDAIAEFEAKRAAGKPSEEQPAEGEEAPEKPADEPEKEDENSPGWIAKARQEIKERRAAMDREYVELKKRGKRERSQREQERKEYDNFKLVRDAWNADMAIAASGTTEQALNAFTRLRAAAGQKGEDFLSEANLAVARNGKKKETDPAVAAELAELRKEREALKKEREDRDQQTRTQEQEQAYQRRQAEVADAVCAPSNAVAAQLAGANRSALFDLAFSYKSAYFEARNEELPDTEAAKLVERDLAVLTKHPRVLAYAKLGNLGQIVQKVRSLCEETDGLDDAGAIGKIDAILAAAQFGSAPASGGLGRATQAQAEPVEPESQELPGRTVSSTRATSSAGSERKLTKDERIAEMLRDGTLEELGITFQN